MGKSKRERNWIGMWEISSNLKRSECLSKMEINQNELNSCNSAVVVYLVCIPFYAMEIGCG